MKSKPSTPLGLALGAVILILMACLPLLMLGLETRARPSAMPMALGGFAINLVFAALLYFVVRTWVRVVVALRAVLGVVMNLLKAFELREQAGEWTTDATVLLLGAGLSAVLFVILLLPLSSRKEEYSED